MRLCLLREFYSERSKKFGIPAGAGAVRENLGLIFKEFS